MNTHRLPWLAWNVVTIAVALVIAAAFASAQVTTRTIRLVPGETFNISLFRFVEDILRVELDIQKTGIEAVAPVFIAATAERQVVQFAAITPSAYGETTRRPLQHVGPTEPPSIFMGATEVMFQILDVGSGLIGAEATVTILPPVGKQCYGTGCALAWVKLLWPMLAAVQLLWGFLLTLPRKPSPRAGQARL
jgi:hypothetical protein